MNLKVQEGIWIIDAEAKTVFANEAMAQILGTTVIELAGQSSFAYIYPEDMPAAALLFDSKKSGDSNAFQFRLRREDGSPIFVDVQGSPTFDAAGAFTGVAGAFKLTE